MNFAQVARPLAGFILFFSLCMAAPLTVAMFEETELRTTIAFTVALAVGLTASAVLWYLGRNSTKDLFRRDGLAVVGLAWVLASGLAAIPLYLSNAIPGAVDALFEGTSGLTTTGATVLGTGGNLTIESLPVSVLLWRSILQWIGGLGIILVFIVLLPAMGVTGSRLLSSEQIGVADEANRPRMADQARRIFLLYVLLTLAAGLCYWLAGLGALDALCHSFTTLASGGFSTNDVSVGGYDNVGVELVAIVFMFITGCNFLLLVRTLLRHHATKAKPLLHSVEFRLYVGLMLTVIAVMTLSLWTWGRPVDDEAVGVVHDYSSFGRCLRDASFQTVSILTTTGYCTADFHAWPKLAVYLLLICMFIGGCTGSTAGGFKVLRVAVCAKLVRHALRHFVRPRTVEPLKLGTEVIPERVVIAVLALLVLWLTGIAAGTLLLTLDSNVDLVASFTTSLSMMCCIGPSIGGSLMTQADAVIVVADLPGHEHYVDVGPYSGYGGLQPMSKLFMCLQMILGRLEILAPLALLTPGFWKRT